MTTTEAEETARELGASMARTWPASEPPMTRTQLHHVAVPIAFALVGYYADMDTHVAVELAFLHGVLGTQQAIQLADRPETEH